VDIRKRFHRALREAGIEGHLVIAGVDLVSVKEFLGHADLKMTLRYAHLAPDYRREAIRRLDTFMDTRQEREVTDHAATL
jgi:site-specific recombinase XerD